MLGEPPIPTVLNLAREFTRRVLGRAPTPEEILATIARWKALGFEMPGGVAIPRPAFRRFVVDLVQRLHPERLEAVATFETFYGPLEGAPAPGSGARAGGPSLPWIIGGALAALWVLRRAL